MTSGGRSRPKALAVLPLLAALLLALAACAASAVTVTPPAATPLPDLATPMAAPSDPEPDEAEAPDTPDPAAAFQQLLAEIPEALRGACTPETYSVGAPLDPGELGGADCDPDGSGGLFVNYSLFDGRASTDAQYDLLKRGFAAIGTVDGPGCGKGPGEAPWDLGRKLCYRVSILNDAKVLWTHDMLGIVADASEDDGDWAKLEAFWGTAGPVAP